MLVHHLEEHFTPDLGLDRLQEVYWQTYIVQRLGFKTDQEMESETALIKWRCCIAMLIETQYIGLSRKITVSSRGIQAFSGSASSGSTYVFKKPTNTKATTFRQPL
jgi:hypothetical protein